MFCRGSTGTFRPEQYKTIDIQSAKCKFMRSGINNYLISYKHGMLNLDMTKEEKDLGVLRDQSRPVSYGDEAELKEATCDVGMCGGREQYLGAREGLETTSAGAGDGHSGWWEFKMSCTDMFWWPAPQPWVAALQLRAQTQRLGPSAVFISGPWSTSLVIP